MPIYDVENIQSYYKSYSDNILIGDPQPVMGLTQWNRSVSGSVVSGSEEWKASTALSDYYFKRTYSFYKSGEPRYLRLSGQKLIEDSITPNIISLYLTGSASGSLGSDATDNAACFTLYFSRDGFSITSSAGTIGERINNTDLFKSYPFEKKYSLVPRVNTSQDFTNAVTIYSGSGIAKTVFDFSSPISFSLNSITNLFPYINICLTKSGSLYNENSVVLEYFSDFTGSYDSSFDIFKFTPLPFPSMTTDFGYGTSFLTEILPKKLIFGINPKAIFSTLSTSVDPAKKEYLQTYATGAIISGWKYGLYNGMPTNFSCVFRQNHYGQFRDMLEGRIYTKTFNDPVSGGPLDANGGINFISGSSLSGESNNYITASIYSGLNFEEAYRVNPFGSGLFDKQYRATQPWHDDDSRVRT